MSKPFDLATTEQVFREYRARFPDAWLNPPLDYGHACIEFDELAELARTALREGRPIPWHDLLAPLPPGAVS